MKPHCRANIETSFHLPVVWVFPVKCLGGWKKKREGFRKILKDPNLAEVFQGWCPSWYGLCSENTFIFLSTEIIHALRHLPDDNWMGYI